MLLIQKKQSFPLVLKLLIPLVFGVIFTFYTSFSWSSNVLYFLFFVLFVLGLPVVSKQFLGRFLFGWTAVIFFFYLGGFLVNLQSNKTNPNYFKQLNPTDSSVFQVRIIEEPTEKANSFKCLSFVNAVDGRKAVGEVLLYFQKDDLASNLHYGDVICLRTNFQEIKPNGNPKEFDYARYLRIHNIYFQAYVKSNQWQSVDNDVNPIYDRVVRIRNFLSDLLSNSGLAPSELMVAKALILGAKDSLDRDTLRTYSSAGAMHVLAVSGLHVGIVMLLLSFLFKPIKLLPKGRILFLVAVLLGIWFYAVITGMSSSVLRSSVMFSFVLIGKEIERENSVYQSILVSAFLLILFEPLVIFQVGFQLSYLAVIGIVYLQPKIYNLWFITNYFGDKIWQITSVSVAAQLATFPLGVYYFHQFPNFFMLSNLIVIPLAFAILLVGLFYFLICWIPLLNELCLIILEFLISFLNKGVQWVESLPYSIYWGLSIEWFEVFWIYLIIILGSSAFILRKSKLLLASLACTFLLCAYNVTVNNYLSRQNELVIYNVNNEVGIDVFTGRNNFFIGTQNLINDEEKMLFHVKHNWFYRTGHEDPIGYQIIGDHNQLLQFGDHTLWICVDPNVPKIPRTDFIYFRKVQFVPLPLIEKVKESQAFVILGDGISYGAKSFIRSQFEDGSYHDLNESGAFTVEY